ncbi:MAG: DegV family protein [uncultured Thermomicrobiales bacterium]|uniref:DegV family protein n=1 Tax=uncultured Thermomicrobiales bacterium TaxID=1645740 RepID=A0A6J4V877_9BACT|nr:MAG: DegV family protein [uncultured Thermomicrobiales bacterium]
MTDPTAGPSTESPAVDGGRRPVRVVTDSTADLPASIVGSLPIAVVPLLVSFGEETFRDGIDLSTADFAARLRRSPQIPKTSQPPVSAFTDVFKPLLDAGFDIACVTIATGLSGTANAARLAAEALDPDRSRIRVVESQSASMATGWCAVVAAERAESGGSLRQVTAAATDAISRYRLYAVLETLEYVYKGGRIGRASQMVGTMLSIKPVLCISEGVVQPVERVRTWKKALVRMAALCDAEGPFERLVILHCDNRADADHLASLVSGSVTAAPVHITSMGPVIGTYAGPGAIGFVGLLPAGRQAS